jgi:hypothetical protein
MILPLTGPNKKNFTPPRGIEGSGSPGSEHVGGEGGVYAQHGMAAVSRTTRKGG